MKFRTVCLFLFIMAIAGSVMAADTQGKVYGKGVSLKDTTAISDIYAHPDKYVGQTVMVEGRIVDVCKKRGCWMEIASDKEYQTIRVKVKDGEIVFPLQARGKLALVEGVVQKFELSREDRIKRLKHHAEEQGQEFDSSSVTEGETFLQLKGIGARIME